MTLLDAIPLLLSGGSLIVAITGLVLTYRRSGQALRESQKAGASALWSGVQQTVQRFIGFDPTMEPVGDRLANFRIAAIALVDELEDLKGLDTWLEAERNLGAVLARQVMESAKPSDTIEERLANLDPYQKWAQRLSQNLRYFRASGFGVESAAELQTSAVSQVKAVCAKHGWALPTTTAPEAEPLR